ncbi:MAG: Holliday junction resolvase RuvX [Myxococcota bacterium]
MRTLGLDIGTRRIGVALSDEMGWTGMPLETVPVRRDGSHLTRIATICRERQVTAIVAGLPLNMDGTEGRAVRQVRTVLAKVRETTGLPIHEWDERLTTVAAERVLKQSGMHHARRRHVVDQLSASLILQGYLEAKANNTQTP